MKMVKEILEEAVGEGMYSMENQLVYCTGKCARFTAQDTCTMYMDMYFDSLLNFLPQC